MVAFLAAIFGVIAVGLARSHPAAVVGTPQPVRISEALGVIVVLNAFAAGCSALTGIEAIANGSRLSASRAPGTELMLGALLATTLIGLSVLIRREHVVPPVLMSLLSADNRLPHLFGLRAERPADNTRQSVSRCGRVALAGLDPEKKGKP